jgi:hypothetical protein
VGNGRFGTFCEIVILNEAQRNEESL